MHYQHPLGQWQDTRARYLTFGCWSVWSLPNRTWIKTLHNCTWSIAANIVNHFGFQILSWSLRSYRKRRWMRQITLIFRAVSCSRVWHAFVSHLDLVSLFGLGTTVICVMWLKIMWPKTVWLANSFGSVDRSWRTVGLFSLYIVLKFK